MFLPVSKYALKAALWMRHIIILLMVFASGNSTYAEQSAHIIIAISPNSQFQLDTATSIRNNLEAVNIRSSIISSESLDAVSDYTNTAVIAIGPGAIAAFNAHEINAPVLLLSNRILDSVKYTSAKASLVLEQPICRDVVLIKALDQDWESIAFLTSINSIEKATGLTRCAIKYGLDFQVYSITDNKDLLKTLKTAIKDNDVLLSVADPSIYNSQTVKNILLTSYRHRKPVIGYSKSFVEAGAIATIYTSSTSAGERAAQIISDFIDNNWQFKSNIYHPTDFSVTTNTQVAKSLDIFLPDNETLHNKIMIMEYK